MRIIAPELVYTGDRFESGLAVAIDQSTGRIESVGPLPALPDRQKAERMPGRALVPGLVNAHSHAFQRIIRGATQWRPANEGADFWSWRESMYRSLLQLTPDDVYDVARFCFIEMLLAGYTTVGEFHYLQRDQRGEPYGNPNELALRVVQAALDAGIRIVVLNTCYATGDVGAPLRAEQRRFATPDLDAFLDATDALHAQLKTGDLTSVGVAPHSVRAIEQEWLRPLADYAASRDLPLHMHVSEQPAEVDAALARYGCRPVELLTANGILSERFTAVHAIHITDMEVAALGAAGSSVCACPTTERDLGDGILAARALLEAGAGLCIGSDSQTVIDPWEEIRLIEYHTRLAALRRVVLTQGSDARQEVGPVLFRAGTQGGARSLRVGTGMLGAGKPADFVLIDLEHSALAGWTSQTLEAMLTLSAPAAVVRDVWVGGVPRVQDGGHPGLVPAQQEFTRVTRRVLS